jgi:hypothetical protein
MEHGGDADPRAQMAGIGGNGEHCLGRGVEQQVIDDSLVVEGDVGDRGWQGEDDMEIADRQQVGLARGEPGARGGTLAPGAVPVAAAYMGSCKSEVCLNRHFLPFFQCYRSTGWAHCKDAARERTISNLYTVRVKAPEPTSRLRRI